MNECIFCQIISGKIPSEIIYKDDLIIVIRDVNPVSPVHVLVIPKEHIQSLNDVEDEKLYQELLSRVVKVARELQIEEAGYRVVINTGRAGGQSVGHLHIHLLGGRELGWPPG